MGMTTDIYPKLQVPGDLEGYTWPETAPPAEGMLLATRQLVRVVGNNASNQSLVLKGIDLDIQRGEFVSIVGASGSGKSTLLYLLGGLDRADHGEIYIRGERLSAMSDARLTAVRNEAVGFVFQFHFLLPEFTATENVMLPMMKLGKRGRKEAEGHARELLERVGLGAKVKRMTTDLSGGEQQRVAIARALANDPDILLADEPTGNLDKKNSQNVAHIFEEIAAAGDRTILMVTHDPHMAERAHRVITLDDGRIVGDVRHADAPAGPALERQT
jgi:lipoprotein-releasing system ATP-binding protein